MPLSLIAILSMFAAKMSQKKDAELRSIVDDEQYVAEARLAALKELEKRGINDSSHQEDVLIKHIDKAEEQKQVAKRMWQDLPLKIRSAITALWISFVISGVSLVALNGYPMEDGISLLRLDGTLLVFALLFSAAITGLFVRGFEKRMDWVRWVYIALSGLSLLSFLMTVMNKPLNIVLLLSTLGHAATVWACISLLHPTANEWFIAHRLARRENELLDQPTEESIEFHVEP